MLNRKQARNNSLNTKIQSVSIGKRIYIHIFLMGVVGAVVGAVDAQIAVKKCLNSENCLVSSSAEKRIVRVGNGICAGMIAASFLSLPAIFNEN